MTSRAVLFAQGRPLAPAPGVASLAPGGILAALSLANRPLLAHAAESLAEAGVTEALIVGEPSTNGHVETALEVADSLGRLTATVIHESDEEPGAADSALADFVDGGPCLLHFGNSLCWTLSEARTSAGDCSGDVTTLLESNRSDATSGGAQLAAVESGMPVVEDDELGIYFVGSDFAAAFREAPASAQSRPRVRAAIAQLGKEGGTVRHSHQPQAWHYRDTPESVLEGNAAVLARVRPGRIPAGVTKTEVHGAVAIDPTASIDSSVLRGPLVIGAGVRIANSYIGPYTAIDRDSEIEGAEIERSVVHQGASIRYLGNRLEGSLVGPGARVFRDFRLPRAVRLEVGPGAQVSLA